MCPQGAGWKALPLVAWRGPQPVTASPFLPSFSLTYHCRVHSQLLAHRATCSWTRLGWGPKGLCPCIHPACLNGRQGLEPSLRLPIMR